MHHLFPINLNLRDRKCLVVGGGSVAERKVRGLLQCGADIWVVSPELTEYLQKLAEEDAINVVNRQYTTDDLHGCSLVISAVDDSAVNSRVADDCFERNIPVNVVDDPARCSFTVPSVLRRGSLCVTVSTDGKSPLLARKIRERLEELFGEEYAEFLDLMGEIRSRVLRDVPDRETRRKIFGCLIDSDILKLIKKSMEYEAESEERIALRRLIEDRIAHCISS